MRTLILGNGLIAKGIARKLALLNGEVIIASRSIDDKIDNVSYKQHSLEEIVSNKELFRNVDHVIHTISTTAPANSMADIYQDASENVLQNIKLIGMLAELKTPKFIFLSSGGAVYGHPSGNKVNEEHATNPVSAYRVAKLAVEKYLYLYGYHFGLNYLIIRPSNVYGYVKSIKKPQGVISHLLDCAKKDKQFKLWGSVHNRKDYLYVDDLAEGIITALEKDGNYTSNVYNMSYGETHSIAEIIAIIEQKTGKKLDIEQVGETKFDVKNIEVDSALFKSDFNWKPRVDIETGISRITDQF